MCLQPISHNQSGQENLEPVNLLWFYSGKGLIFSHVQGKQNGKQMRNLGKMLHICRRKSLGMEIKVIFIQHENGIICRLEGLCSLIGAVVKNVPSHWAPSAALSSFPSDKVTAVGVSRWHWHLPSMTWLLRVVCICRFGFVTDCPVKANFVTSLYYCIKYWFLEELWP